MAFVHTRDQLPRGIRNNNPLNIRENQRIDFDWEGELPIEVDDAFEEFVSPEYGFRAAARILKSYSNRGVRTLEGIISRWAPAGDNNDVESYIASVQRNTGIDRYAVVGKAQYVDLMAAMTLHENGQQPYTRDVIARGVELANV